MKKQNLKVLLSLLAILLTFQFSYGQGSRYTGDYKKTEIIRHVRTNNLVFDGLEFINNSEGRCIELYDCENVIIKNCRFVSPYNHAIYLYGCKNVTIEDCSFENVNFALKASTSQGVRFNYNDVLNITGYMYTDKEFGGVAQFINVTGANNSISFNACENIPGKSDLEDVINTFGLSGGTASSPLMIKGNWIRGGGTSGSGTGIVIGDYGGSYTIVEENILVNPGQAGIGIAGGQHMTMRNNKVYSTRMDNTNVGMVVYNWTENQHGKFENIVVENNRINYISRNGDIGSWWMPDEKNLIKGKETNIYDKSLTASILPDKIIGRARDNVSDNNGSNEPENNGSVQRPDNNNDGSNNNNQENVGSGPSSPSENEQVNSPITIYVDTYNRICVNVRGRIYRSANVSVTNPNGRRIYTQPLTGYHTVVRSRIDKGTYTVIVKNGNQTRNQQIVIN